MANFAVIQGSEIVNVIVADSAEIAQEVTKCEVIETTGEPWIGWRLINGVWSDPSAVEEIDA